jgi:hypothetical protein
LQRAAIDASPVSDPPTSVHDVLRSPGQPLDASTRAFLEPRFGHDLSQVPVHSDAQAAGSAQAVNALAYTVGQNVVFGAGQYAPQTTAGRKLIAHELAHTLQQGDPSVPFDRLQVSEPGDTWETEANHVAEAALINKPFPVVSKTGRMLARQEPEGPSPDTPEALEEKRKESEEKKKIEEALENARKRARDRIPKGALHSWGWGGPETDNVYTDCEPEGVSRSEFLSFYKVLPKTAGSLTRPAQASAPLAITIQGPPTLPEIATKPVQETDQQSGQTHTYYKLKPTHAEMPPMLSRFTQGEFVEGVAHFGSQGGNPCQSGNYPIRWIIIPDGALAEGEREHCTDVRTAFDLTLAIYASAINNTAAAERLYSTPQEAERDVIARLGVPKASWRQNFDNLVAKSQIRDSQTNRWHTPQFRTIDTIRPGEGSNGCQFYINKVSKATLPHIGKHPSEDIIK